MRIEVFEEFSEHEPSWSRPKLSGRTQPRTQQLFHNHRQHLALLNSLSTKLCALSWKHKWTKRQPSGVSAALLPNAINQVIFGPVQKLARRPFAGSDHPSDRHFPQLKTPFPRFPPRAALRQLPTAAGPGPAPRRHLPPSESPDPPCSPDGPIPQTPHRVPAAAPRREGRRWEEKPTR